MVILLLRERVAKRLSVLKKSGAKTPLINEVPLKAEVIDAKSFDGSYIQEILNRIRGGGTPGNGVSVPTIVKGHLFGAEPGRWYSYTFPKQLSNVTVVANAKARTANWINTNIDRVTRDDFNSAYYCDLVGTGARDRAKNLGPPYPLDIVWDWFCDTFVYWTFYAGWLVSGWILNVLWDGFVQKQIDRVQTALNKRIQDLYQMWGLPQNLSMSTVMLRNITPAGFEFLSLGNMDVYFTAIGD